MLLIWVFKLIQTIATWVIWLGIKCCGMFIHCCIRIAHFIKNCIQKKYQKWKAYKHQPSLENLFQQNMSTNQTCTNCHCQSDSRICNKFQSPQIFNTYNLSNGFRRAHNDQSRDSSTESAGKYIYQMPCFNPLCHNQECFSRETLKLEWQRYLVASSVHHHFGTTPSGRTIQIRKQTFLTCNKCKYAVYCSRECRKIHWNVHKVECDKNII